MAVTGNKSGSFNGQYPSYATPYIFWSYEQSIPYNNTVLTAELKVKREKTGSTTYKATTPWSLTIGGTKTSGNVNFKITNVSAGEYITIGKASKTFTHKDDGSIDLISISATIDLSGTSLGTGTVSTSVTPETIARASILEDISDFTIGESIPITFTSYLNSFTHELDIYFTVGGVDIKTISGITSGTNVNFTDSEFKRIYEEIPNGTTVKLSFILRTYYNGTEIGSSTKHVTGILSTSIKPIISNITITEASSTVPSSWGVYVRGKSALKVEINASGVYGSSITGYKITGIDSITYNESNFTSAVLQEAKTYTVKVVVTDSRTRTTETEVQVVCVAYNNPIISAASVRRCNADGSANEKGTSVKYTFNASVSPVNNKNTYAYKLGYKKSTDDYFTYIDIPNNSYTLDKSNVVISGVTFDSSSTYVFDFFVADYFTSTSNTSNKINSGFKLINFNKSGKGMAFGKFSEKDALEIGIPTELIGGIDGDIISNDNNSKWQINGNSGATPIPGSGCGILSGGDGANETTANMKLYSWFGIGFSPSIDGQPIPRGENAVYINTRNGDLTARGNITAPKFNGTATNADTARVAGAADSAGALWSRGILDPESGQANIAVHGISMSQGYNNGYPATFGNVLNIRGAGSSQLFMEWRGNSSSGNLWYRSLRDYLADGTTWGSWVRLVEEREKSIVSNTDNTSSYIVLGNLLICWGRTLITPSANNTPTVKALTFPKSFAVIPMVLTGACSAVPGTKVTGTSATNITTTGCDIYVTRTNTTDTAVNWLAIGQVS